jgi:hypothetical protein
MISKLLDEYNIFIFKMFLWLERNNIKKEKIRTINFIINCMLKNLKSFEFFNYYYGVNGINNGFPIIKICDSKFKFVIYSSRKSFYLFDVFKFFCYLIPLAFFSFLPVFLLK